MKAQKVKTLVTTALGLSATSLVVGGVAFLGVITLLVLDLTAVFPSGYSPPQRFDSIQNVSYPARVVVETDGTVIELEAGNPSGTNYTEFSLTWDTPINPDSSQFTVEGSLLFAGGVGTSVLSLEDKGVAGTYVNPTVTLNDEGLVTAAANGTAGGGGVLEVHGLAPNLVTGGSPTNVTIDLAAEIEVDAITIGGQRVIAAAPSAFDLSIPALGANSDVVTTGENQVVTGDKTFDSAVLAIEDNAELRLYDPTESTYVRLKEAAGTTTYDFVFPTGPGNPGDVLTSDGTATAWAAPGAVAVNGTADEIDVACALGTCTVGLVPNPHVDALDIEGLHIVAENATPRTYTVPDAGANAEFVMNEGARSLTGQTDLNSLLSMRSGTAVEFSNAGNTGAVRLHADAAMAGTVTFALPALGWTNAGYLLATDGVDKLYFTSITASGTISAGANIVTTPIGNDTQISTVAVPTFDGVILGNATLLPPVNATATTTLTLPPDAGLENYVLATNGAGNTAWGRRRASAEYVEASFTYLTVSDTTVFSLTTVAPATWQNLQERRTGFTYEVDCDIYSDRSSTAVTMSFTIGTPFTQLIVSETIAGFGFIGKFVATVTYLDVTGSLAKMKGTAAFYPAGNSAPTSTSSWNPVPTFSAVSAVTFDMEFQSGWGTNDIKPLCTVFSG